MNTWRHLSAFDKIMRECLLRGIFVKRNRWFIRLASLLLLFSIMEPVSVMAEKDRLIEDESIYDLLVDRFYNGNNNNDEGINTQDGHAFSGGDFLGITEKASYISELGFTLASIGSVFETATYDGNEVLTYEAFEPHFGTEEEFTQMIGALRDRNVGTIVDFPLNGISEQHEWIQNDSVKTITTEKGIQWDPADEVVGEKLTAAIVSFVERYDNLAGIRLTHLGNFDDTFLNDLIAKVKEVNSSFYVLSNEQSTAQFDLMPHVDKRNALIETYAQVDPDSTQLKLFEDQKEDDLIQLDELMGPRFTYEMTKLRMYPPTRWKVATTALFTLPGIPVLTYESEIAVNGKEAPESHPIVNFKTDTELYDHIADMNKLRNQSETLRNGEFELLHNQDGFTVFTRTSDEEKWIVVLNNTSVTSDIELDAAIIGDDKRLRGLLEGESFKQSKDGKYRIVLERELAEVFIVDEDPGYNTPYLIVSILIYSSFFGLLFVIFRRGKRNKEAQ